ncbi:hypothetical protein, partial [Paenarthrobacter sp. 22069]|uniref:hypothetical protein n=1 Tax=Paenarthrobacter sp. 22069 TaxID=3453864 RepID=UPI003F85E00E
QEQLRKWADLMATSGQFYWPSVGNFVAAYGQFFMAAYTGRSSQRSTAKEQDLRQSWRAAQTIRV